MIECVARAIAATSTAGTGEAWKIYEDHARAAIAAMHEPTEAMIQSILVTVVGMNNRGEILRDWHKMIDAALNEMS